MNINKIEKLTELCDRIIIILCLVLGMTFMNHFVSYLDAVPVKAEENYISVKDFEEPLAEYTQIVSFIDNTSRAVKPSIEEEPELITDIEVSVLEPNYRMIIDDETLEILTRVTEAEVTGDEFIKNGSMTYDELLKCKIRVAQVFMNRVEDNDSFNYIDDLKESLTYKNASSTFNDGRYYEVKICDITREAVRLALLADTPDYTEGALYFASGTKTSIYGDFIFTDEVGHSFFK